MADFAPPAPSDLVGRRVRFLQATWQVVEVWPHEQALVLEAAHAQVQGSQYGEGYRRAPQRLAVPLEALHGDPRHPGPTGVDLLPG
jgi:hypothetical protein